MSSAIAVANSSLLPHKVLGAITNIITHPPWGRCYGLFIILFDRKRNNTWKLKLEPMLIVNTMLLLCSA